MSGVAEAVQYRIHCVGQVPEAVDEGAIEIENDDFEGQRRLLPKMVAG
jgi:hypothetical protein